MSGRSDRAPVGPLLTWSSIGLALLYSGSRPVASNDLHIYLAMGREMVRTGRLMDTEVFTWTAQGTPFINATWGFSVLAWLGHQLVGLDGLRLFNAFLVAAAVGLPVLAARALGADGRAGAIGALYAFAMLLQNTALRSQTWVYPLFGLLVWLTARPRPAAAVAAGGLLIGAAWANLHGSFPAALVYLGALAVGALVDRRPAGARTPAIAAAAVALGACLGPYGPRTWAYVLSNSALPQARGFSEWLPPDPTELHGIRLLAAVGTWIVLLGRSRRRAETSTLLLLLGFGLLAFRGQRFVSWFGLATTLPLVREVDRLLAPSPGLPRRVVRGLGAVLAACWALFLYRGLRLPEGPLREETPLELVAILDRELPAKGPPQRILNPPEYGGLLSFALWPRLLTSGDIRTWLFDDDAWNLYATLSAAPPGWDDRLEELGVTWLLLWDRVHGRTLIPAARAHPAWREVGATEHMVLLHRVSAAAAAEPVGGAAPGVGWPAAR